MHAYMHAYIHTLVGNYTEIPYSDVVECCKTSNAHFTLGEMHIVLGNNRLCSVLWCCDMVCAWLLAIVCSNLFNHTEEAVIYNLQVASYN